MASIGSNEHVNILVQWYKPSNEGIWRYKVEKGFLSLDSHVRINTDGSSSKDLIDAMTWAVTKYPAEHYGLILWNHGIGILDPVWGESVMKMNSKRTQNNPRATISGITKPFDDEPITTQSTLATQNTSSQASLFPKILPNSQDKMAYRGILFNEKTKTYMDNQALLYSLETIKTSVLKGKKLKLLGMDACLMAMLEIGYQVRNHAEILVASQEVELAYGWNYINFLNALAGGNTTPLQAAQHIVSGYENLYKNKIQFYTQSALDLDLMEDIKNGLDLTVICLNDCKKISGPGITDLVKRSRNSALQFSSPTYIDLYSFYTELRRNLAITYGKNKSQSLNKNFLKKIAELNEVIDISMQLIEKSVVANAAGKYLAKAKGISIYYPNNEEIDSSYKKSLFGQDSLWLNFLTKFTAP